MNKRPTIIQLFLSFLRLGLTVFGGPAMVQYIKELSVKRNKWIVQWSSGYCCCPHRKRIAFFGKGILRSYKEIFISAVAAFLFWSGISPFIV